MSELIQTERDERTLIIRINRAEKKNALTQAMYTAMADALTSAATDSDVRVIVFTGSGDAFTSGNDLQDFLKVPHKPDLLESPVGKFMQALCGFPKPVIAAVNGTAVGIGVTLLLHSDLVYVADGARLQMPFVNLGICAEFASSFLLPRIMGHARAAELLLFGEPFSAKTAYEYGLVNAVLPTADVLPHALERARKLSAQPPNALRVTKKLMRKWSSEDVMAAILLEAQHFIPMLREAEAMEVMSAFMQKRKPDFSKFA